MEKIYISNWFFLVFSSNVTDDLTRQEQEELEREAYRVEM